MGRMALAIVAAGVAATAAAGLWAWRTESGLAWMLARVPGLQVEGLSGRLADGPLAARRLTYTAGAQGPRVAIEALQLDGLTWRWHPHAGAWLGLSLAAAQAQRVVLDTGTGPAAQAPPASLRWPVALGASTLTLDELRIDALPPARSIQGSLVLGDEHGSAHRIELRQARIEKVALSGRLRVATDAELPVDAEIDAQAASAGDDPPPQRTPHSPSNSDPQGGTPWQAHARLTGPLAALQATVDLRGVAADSSPTATPGRPPGTTRPAAPSLQARARIAPWAAWPITALDLDTHAFDLASLSPRLPATLIDGQAHLATPARRQPAEARVQLSNLRPGRLDQGALPVRQIALVASAMPDQPQQVSLDRLDVQLSDGHVDAGRLQGRGHWRDQRLTIDSTLNEVQPSRLDQRAAPLRLSGPMTLELSGLFAGANLATPTPPASGASGAGRNAPLASGPMLAVRGQWQGQVIDGPAQPVALSVALQAGADHVAIERLEARAGAAVASLAGRAERDAGAWHLTGNGRLEAFDPLPWWRGAEGSVWRRGPHRLDARVEADLRWRPRPASRAIDAPPSLAIDRLQSLLADIDGHLDLAWGAAAGTPGTSPSLLAGVPIQGSARLRSQGPSAEWVADAQVGPNQLSLRGQIGAHGAADRWELQWRWPSLETIAPLMAWAGEVAPELQPWLPVAGQTDGQASVDGRWPQVWGQGHGQLRGWRSPSLQLQSAQVQARLGPGDDPSLSLQLSLAGVDQADADPGATTRRLDRLTAQAQGTLAEHQVSWLLDSPARPPAWAEPLLGPSGTGTRLEGEGRGRWSGLEAGAGTTGWRWQLDRLSLRGGARDAGGQSRPWMAAADLQADVQLDGHGRARQVSLAPGRVKLLSTGLRWQQARWQAGEGSPRFDLQAELETLDVAALLQRLQPGVGWGGDLVLGGSIDVHAGERIDADVVLDRRSGDLRVSDELGQVQPLGLTELRLALTVHDGLWQFAQGFHGTQVGEMAGAQVIRTTADRRWPPPAAPLQGVLEARVAQLGVWGLWVPPGWRLGGSLSTRATVGGSVGAPEFSGRLQGQGLAARNLLQGIQLADGELQASLEGDRARIERFGFKGGDGRLDLTGEATLGATPTASLRVAADRFRLLGRIDRRLVASGQAELRLDRDSVALEGRVHIDEGLFDLSQSDAPALDADVQVRAAASAPGRGESPGPNGSNGLNGGALPSPAEASAAATAGPRRQTRVALQIDLGERLRLRGRGLDTRLQGQLALSAPDRQLAVHGSVRAVDGTYAAYGQKMEIQRGEVVFSGPLANPRLDVLAVRPNLDVVVGVGVTGTAQQPRIRLVAEPEMPEIDKLSWLVLGRGTDGLGRTDTALLQRAAVALLAGEGKAPTDEFLAALGLTDFSVRQTDGEVRETIVSLGRQLSRRWYVGYERSLNATTGTWQLIYRIAQRFTLRAQSGAETSLDLIWSWRWE